MSLYSEYFYSTEINLLFSEKETVYKMLRFEGVLALAQIHKRKPPVSMLVVKLEANYFKKATGRTRFTCEDGLRFREIIEETIHSGESRSLVAKSTGINEEGEKVAEFFITWSFKARRA